MRVRYLVQCFRCLGLRVFPRFAPAEGRLGTKTRDPRASLGQTQLNRVTAPPKDSFGQEGVAFTIDIIGDSGIFSSC